MTKEELYKALDYVNHSRQQRQQMSQLILTHPELVRPLMEIAFSDNGPISSKASWVLEFTTKKDMVNILAHIDLFVDHIHKVTLDSSVRPMAKICELLIIAYYSKKTKLVHETISHTHLEQIATACFDWLIGNHKVAAKAYSMTSLLLLGNSFDWIHPELKMVLEQNYAKGSAAYKARARMVLAKLP